MLTQHRRSFVRVASFVHPLVSCELQIRGTKSVHWMCLRRSLSFPLDFGSEQSIAVNRESQSLSCGCRLDRLTGGAVSGGRPIVSSQMKERSAQAAESPEEAAHEQ